MRIRVFPAGLIICLAAWSASGKTESGVRLMPDLGEVYHPVTTNDREAQAFFDQIGRASCRERV